MENLIRSRVVRSSVAATLVVAGIWGFFPYISGDVATSAYVNTELRRVVTPISGVVGDHLPEAGEYLARNVESTLVSAPTPDRIRLDDLTRQAALARTTAELVAAQIRDLDSESSSLRARGSLFRSASVQYLEARVAQAEADAGRCAAVRADQELKLGRARALAEKGFLADAGLRSAETAYREAEQGCRSAAAGLQALKTELAAARRGVHLNDGSNDTPFADQQRARLVQQRHELMAQKIKADSELALLTEQLRKEQARLDRASAYRPILPAGHLVWSVEGSPGAEIEAGSAVLDLADCRRRFVVVTLPARKIEHLHVGDTAKVRLVGSGQWTTGRIRRITGSAARAQERSFVAEIPRANGRDFTVEVSLAPAADAALDRSCDLGRLAEVRFGGPAKMWETFAGSDAQRRG